LTPIEVAEVNLSGDDSGVLTSSYAGFVHDLDNDRYLVYATVDSSAGRIYAIDPETGVMTRLYTSPYNVGANAPLRLMYLPKQHCIVFLSGSARPIEFMPTA
jgi:hypothetical protein